MMMITDKIPLAPEPGVDGGAALTARDLYLREASINPKFKEAKPFKKGFVIGGQVR